MSLLGLVVPAAVLCSILVVALWARQRVAVRRAGVSADSPGCPKCLYLVRGWNSPVCPECGTDVRTAGVVTGVRLPRWLKLLAALLLTAAVMIPLTTLLVRAAFMYRTSISIFQFRSVTALDEAAFNLDLRTVRTKWSLPARTTAVTQLTLDPSSSMDGINVHYRVADGWAPPVEDESGSSAAWITWRIEDDESVPSVQQILTWLGKNLGVAPSPMLAQQAQEIHARLLTSRTGGPMVATTLTPQSVFSGISSGTGNAFGMAPGGAWLSIGLPALCLALVGGHVWYRHRSGWRPVRHGEWASSTPAADIATPAHPTDDACRAVDGAQSESLS